jgi:flagella basal body P-ring formation protein FlgA
MTLAAAALIAGLSSAAPVAGALTPDVHAALVAAVRARMGDDAELVIGRVETPRVPAGGVVDVVLAPGASTRGPIRLLLRGPVDRAGGRTVRPVASAGVELRVIVTHWHTTGAVARGAALAEEDLAAARHVLAPGPLRRPAARGALVGARVVRDLDADACLAQPPVIPVMAVRAGEDVTAWVREPGLELRTTMVAVDGGAVGSTIRVRPVSSRKSLRARVVGRAEVEMSDAR